MGIYLNPGNYKFKKAKNSQIYVDKSLLIEYTNKVIDTNDNCICVSRPRRFGKSTDANMLVAYYSKDCDSSSLFDDLKISQVESYKTHMNNHNVIHIDMQKCLSSTDNVYDMIQYLSKRVIKDLKLKYTEYCDEPLLSDVFNEIYAYTKDTFIFVIDEWDCLFREYKDDKEAQKKYLDFLRLLLKEQPYVSLVYMTGILPIKKYGTHSALNMFKEISMIDSTPLSSFMGFTETEVKELCEKYNMDFSDMQSWYDGYHLDEDISVYSPRSVVYALQDRKYGNYWTSTETYEALKIYIDMDFDRLKENIIKLLNNEKVEVNTSKFQNDMTTFKTQDDVLTLLVHLGYLGYDNINKEVYIPNKEVTDSFINSIEDSSWNETTKALLNSKELLEATWTMKEEQVAHYIEQAHLHTSIIQYNDENALSYTLSLAYYTARDYYTMIREMPSGKGYADIVFIPKKDKPAMVIELKWDKDVDTAIKQIKDKNYIHGLDNYLDNLLLVGISYNKETKKHECMIEKYKS